MRKALLISAAAMAFGVAAPAHASLVFQSNVLLTAQGFGNAPRSVTIQANGNASGCVSAAGGVISTGSGACVANATVFQANSVQNVGGAEVNPVDSSKFGIPTLGSLGITSAGDIAILFNATEPDNAITVTDITLKIFSASGAFLGAIDTAGSVNFTDLVSGNGGAGFTFGVDADQTSFLQGLINTAGSGGFLATELSVTGAAGGPESLAIVNRNRPTAPVPEPATWAMMLVGFGMLGGAMRRKGKTNVAGRVRFA